MESDLGKLFIGGISWNTDEERLNEYFTNCGEVVEAVIMRDRSDNGARFSAASLLPLRIEEPLLIEGESALASAVAAAADVEDVVEEKRKPVIGEDHTIMEALSTVDFWI
ncbi:Heterogeneous nuclear ribonucleoprotein 1 [Linum grandiflorum]